MECWSGAWNRKLISAALGWKSLAVVSDRPSSCPWKSWASMGNMFPPINRCNCWIHSILRERELPSLCTYQQRHAWLFKLQMKKDASIGTYVWTTWRVHHAAWGGRHESVQCCGNTMSHGVHGLQCCQRRHEGRPRENQTPCCCVLVSACPLCNRVPRAPGGCTLHDTATKSSLKTQVGGQKAQIANPPTQTRQTWRPGRPAS